MAMLPLSAMTVDVSSAIYVKHLIRAPADDIIKEEGVRQRSVMILFLVVHR